MVHRAQHGTRRGCENRALRPGRQSVAVGWRQHDVRRRLRSSVGRRRSASVTAVAPGGLLAESWACSPNEAGPVGPHGARTVQTASVARPASSDLGSGSGARRLTDRRGGTGRSLRVRRTERHQMAESVHTSRGFTWNIAWWVPSHGAGLSRPRRWVRLEPRCWGRRASRVLALSGGRAGVARRPRVLPTLRGRAASARVGPPSHGLRAGDRQGGHDPTAGLLHVRPGDAGPASGRVVRAPGRWRRGESDSSSTEIGEVEEPPRPGVRSTTGGESHVERRN